MDTFRLYFRVLGVWGLAHANAVTCLLQQVEHRKENLVGVMPLHDLRRNARKLRIHARLPLLRA